MPIYEYQCKACAKEMEVLQKISDAPLQDCPACGEASLKKKVSAAAFRLKGGGWYETDFKTGVQDRWQEEPRGRRRKACVFRQRQVG
jgi:putative FmdB family regulatory protein